MNNKIKDILFVITVVIVAFCLYHVPNFYAPNKTRYSEVAREMLANHNFIVPYIDGMIFFHKPPLVYWLTYIFMSILEYFGSKISKFSITRYIFSIYYLYHRKKNIRMSSNCIIILRNFSPNKLLIKVVNKIQINGF